MSCLDRQELLQEYLEGGLEAGERSQIELHLRGCPSCRRDLEAYRALLQELPAMPDPPIPVDLSAQVMAAVRARRLAHAPEREAPMTTIVRRVMLTALGATFTITMGIALWGWSSRFAAFAGRTLSHDLVAMWEAARDLWSLVLLLGELAGVLRPVAQQLWSVLWRASGPLAAFGPMLLVVYVGVLVLGALLCWRALFPWGERRLTHASS